MRNLRQAAKRQRLALPGVRFFTDRRTENRRPIEWRPPLQVPICGVSAL
jgi:hypothetical protein